MLYFGSCRYMYERDDYQWNCFLGRLHTTREICQLLEMFEGDYTTWINTKFSEPESKWLLSDIGHSHVKWGWEGSGLQYAPTQEPKEIKDVIIEVSSKKVHRVNYRGKLIWCSTHYLNVYNKDLAREGEFVSLTQEDIDSDLKRINELIKEKFHPEAKLHVIPHLNLKQSKTEGRLPSRDELTNWLDEACDKYDINFCNVATHLEEVYGYPYLDRCMSDKTHYTAGFEDVMKFLNEKIVAS